MLTLCIDLYWSFRSPYSYILLPRIIDLQRMYNVTVDLRVVHPAALRNPAYFARMDPQARPYFLLDSARAASFHGLPFRRPVPETPRPCRLRPINLWLCGSGDLASPRQTSGAGSISRGKWRHCCGAGRSMAGTTARIWPGPPPVRALIWRCLTAPSPPPRVSTSALPRMMHTCARPDTGVCRPWCFKASRSLARTGSTCCWPGYATMIFLNGHHSTRKNWTDAADAPGNVDGFCRELC